MRGPLDPDLVGIAMAAPRSPEPLSLEGQAASARHIIRTGTDEADARHGSGRKLDRYTKPDPSCGADVAARRMTLRLPDDAWEALDALAPEGERASLIAYLLRCERKRQLGGAT